MKDCPSCSAAVQDDARFCLDCGHAFESAERPAADDPWTGRVIAGRFKINRKLGEGGMGEVFVAEQMPMGRSVALKILRQELSGNAEQVERFKREAQAASQLSHPNTIIVHDFGQDDDGTLFIAMEFLEGNPLDAVLEEEGTLSADRTARILMQTCGSLKEAHERGMVHRDLKPENIFLTERGGTAEFVKVLDFGIAKISQTSKGDKLEPITQAGAIFGTPHFMSPEQIRGEDLDARSDVYALGVILYRMIAGELPFKAGNVVEMLTQHLTAAPEPITTPSELVDQQVAQLEAIALRALSKSPDDRQASTEAFLAQILEAVPTAAGISGPHPTVPDTGDTPRSAGEPVSEAPDMEIPEAVFGAAEAVMGTAGINIPEPLPAKVETAPPKEGGKTGLIVTLLLLLLGGGGAGGYFFLYDQPTTDPTGPITIDLGIRGVTPSADASGTTPTATRQDAAAAVAPIPDAAPVKPAMDAAPMKPVVDAAPVKPIVDAAPVKQVMDAAPARPVTKRDAKPIPVFQVGKDPVVNKPTPKGRFGRLTIITNRRNAKIFVDGLLRGRAPLKTLRLKAGKHRIEARHKRQRKRKTVKVVAKKNTKVRIPF